MFELFENPDREDPNPPPNTNNHNNGVKIAAMSLLFSLKNTLNSLNHSAYSFPNSKPLNLL